MVAALIGKLWPEKDPVTPAGPYIAGGRGGGGQLPPPGKLNVFFLTWCLILLGYFL